MDEHYDYQAAGAGLESITQDRVKRKAESQLSVMTEETINQLSISQTAFPTRWRVTLPVTTAAKELEEVVLRIQGIITNKDLPPIVKDKHRKPNDAKFLRQGVQITGVGAPSFAKSIQTIATLFSLFSRGFKDGDLHVWKPDVFMTHSAINVFNRYFYDSRDCPDQASVPLGDAIDPDHYLAALALAAGVIHTVDNQVEYFKATPEKKFINTNPSSFRVGDIVEALLTIVIIPVKQRKYQMMLVLRGLTLLDGHHTTAAQSKRLNHIASSSRPISALPLKRKACYDEDEEVQQVRKGIRDMSV